MTISKRDNYCCGSAGLAIGSTTSQFSTARAVTVVINGAAYNCAADATQAFSTATALTTYQWCAFYILSDTSGVLTSQQSDIVTDQRLPSGTYQGSFGWPEVTDKAVIGAVLVRSGSAVFTPGTTALTGVATYFDRAFDYGKAIVY